MADPEGRISGLRTRARTRQLTRHSTARATSVSPLLSGNCRVVYPTYKPSRDEAVRDIRRVVVLTAWSLRPFCAPSRAGTDPDGSRRQPKKPCPTRPEAIRPGGAGRMCAARNRVTPRGSGGSNPPLSAPLSDAASGAAGAQRDAVEHADQVTQLARLGERAREGIGHLRREGACPARRHEDPRQREGERGVEGRRVGRRVLLHSVQIGEHEGRRGSVEEALRGGVGEGGARERQRAQDARRSGGEEEPARELERGCGVEEERSAWAAHGDVWDGARDPVLHNRRDGGEREGALEARLGDETFGFGRRRGAEPDRELSVEPEPRGEAAVRRQLARKRHAA